MYLEKLHITDFRSYEAAHFEPPPTGLTVVTGANGAGKTNLVEAVGYLATLRSLRGVPSAALIRAGADQAVLRSVVSGRQDRRIAIDALLSATGRDRAQVNGRALRRAADLLGSFAVTVFSPDDLALVKGGPAARRAYLDELMVALVPRRYEILSELERVLRQRNALLKSAFTAGWRPGRPLPQDVEFTLDVWDAKLAAAGDQLVEARTALVEQLQPHAVEAYAGLAGGSAPPGRLAIRLGYQPSWAGPLDAAIAAARQDDLRRGVTTVGPQRDDLCLEVGGLPARTHASQGEQRTLALALRLAAHRLLAAALGSPPVLLLDDVFSELDPARSGALMANLPSFSDAQAVLTTAGALPAGAGVHVSARFRVEGGRLVA